MVTRREWIERAVGAGASLALAGRLSAAEKLSVLQNPQNGIITRAIPSTGEVVPALGLGSANTFSAVARTEDLTALKGVMKALVDSGARVLDTAPGYGASEQAAGDIAAELGITNRIFWATKVNAAGGRGGAPADLPARARAQIEESFKKLRVPKIDIIQVHNLAEVPTQLGVLKEFKKDGRVRYIGVTTTSESQYPQLQQIMNTEPIDFIGVDYAVDNREVETTILPLAQQKKIGVLVYFPFGRTRLWQRVAAAKMEKPPEWAREFDAATWAQFFIKYVISHPAVTVVTPGTSNAEHMLDNIGGGKGRLPDAATLAKMREFVDALPRA